MYFPSSSSYTPLRKVKKYINDNLQLSPPTQKEIREAHLRQEEKLIF